MARQMSFFLVEMAAAPQPPLPGMADEIAGMKVHQRRLFFQFLRQPVIVGIEEGDHRAARMLDGQVSGGGRPLVAVLTQPAQLHAGFADQHALDQFPAAVRRAVIDHNDLFALDRLAGNRPQGPVEHGCTVVDGDDDRNRDLSLLQGQYSGIINYFVLHMADRLMDVV